MLDRFEDLLVDPPLYRAEVIQDMAKLRDVGLVQEPHRLSKLGVDLGHLGLLQVVPTKVVVLPGCWPVDHGQGTLELEIEIVDLVQFTHEFLHEALVEHQVALGLGHALALSLWLQEEVLLLADPVLEALAHDVRQVPTDFDLGLFAEGPDLLIVDE